ALTGAIRARNRRRELLGTLCRWRESASPPLGTAVERALRASEVGDPGPFDGALARWMCEGCGAFSGPRLLLAGSAPPDERLHAAVERAGGCVVDEVGDHSLDRLGLPIGMAPDPLGALARHYHGLDYGPRSFTDRAAQLVRRAAKSRANGVLVWLI